MTLAEVARKLVRCGNTAGDERRVVGYGDVDGRIVSYDELMLSLPLMYAGITGLLTEGEVREAAGWIPDAIMEYGRPTSFDTFRPYQRAAVIPGWKWVVERHGNGIEMLLGMVSPQRQQFVVNLDEVREALAAIGVWPLAENEAIVRVDDATGVREVVQWVVSPEQVQRARMAAGIAREHAEAEAMTGAMLPIIEQYREAR